MVSGGVEFVGGRVFLSRYARCEYKDVFAKKTGSLLKFQ